MSEFFGMYRGTVLSDVDPEGLARIKALVPAVLGATTSTDWCWPCVPPGSVVTIPPVGSKVWITFEGGDTDYPIWMGTWATPPKTGHGAVTSVFGRTGAVVAKSGDYTYNMVGADASGTAAAAQAAAIAASEAYTNANALSLSTVTTAGDLIYGTGAGAVTRLPIGANATLLGVASGLPAYRGGQLISTTVSSNGTAAPNSFENCNTAAVTRTVPSSPADGTMYGLVANNTGIAVATTSGVPIFHYGTSVTTQITLVEYMSILLVYSSAAASWFVISGGFPSNYLLSRTDSSAAETYSLSSNTSARLDNAGRLDSTFVVPPSGNVRYIASIMGGINVYTGGNVMLSLGVYDVLASGLLSPFQGVIVASTLSGANPAQRCTCDILFTGLTAGASKTWSLAYATANTSYFASDSGAGEGYNGPAAIRVLAA